MFSLSMKSVLQILQGFVICMLVYMHVIKIHYVVNINNMNIIVSIFCWPKWDTSVI